MSKNPEHQLEKYDINVSRETLHRLNLYHDLIIKWQKTINLVSGSTLNDIWERHIIDSAQIYELIDPDKPIVDLGSGAGFPGLVLAMMGAEQMHLIESDQRKSTFLREAARITNTIIRVHNERIENLSDVVPSYITARACAPITTLLTISSHFYTPDTKYLFLKGKNYTKELDEAKEHWEFDFTVLPSKINKNDGVILVITNVKPGCHGQSNT